MDKKRNLSNESSITSETSFALNVKKKDPRYPDQITKRIVMIPSEMTFPVLFISNKWTGLSEQV